MTSQSSSSFSTTITTVKGLSTGSSFNVTRIQSSGELNSDLVVVISVACAASVGLLATVVMTAWIVSCCRRGQIWWKRRSDFKRRAFFEDTSSTYTEDVGSDPGVDSIFVPYGDHPPIATRFSSVPAAEPYNLLPVQVPYRPYIFDDMEGQYVRADAVDSKLSLSSPALHRKQPFKPTGYLSEPDIYMTQSAAYF